MKPDPFAPERLAARRRRVFELLPPGTDCAIAGAAGDAGARLYLTGAHEGTAVVTPEGVTLVAHVMFAEAAARSGWPVVEYRTRHQHEAAIRRAVGRARRIAMPLAALSAAGHREWRRRLPDRRWTDSSSAVRKTASVKDEAEIALLREMTRVISRVMARVPGWLREGITERELKVRIECAVLRAGAKVLTFGTLVSFGENTSLPHALVGERRLRPGDLVMIDGGGARHGYGSDMTRTFCFGRAKPRQKKIHRTVRDARQLAFELFEKGRTLRQVNRAVDRLFRRAGFGPFIHSVGHTLGPVPGEVEPVPGCVFTIEPGIYVRGYAGVRIEDDVLVTEQGLETLTDFPPDLLEVK